MVAARYGQEALSALASRDEVRLVVSDVAMPVMSRGMPEPGRPFIQKPSASDLFARRVAELLQQLGR
ncbi:MAG: hypothetical protein ABJC36_01595 [Gemmatimonadales bacterium]